MILLDTHTILWVLGEPEKLSDRVRAVVEAADGLAVAGITWYELAWLIDAGRIEIRPDPANWLRDADQVVTTLPITWQVAHSASVLSGHGAFPKDPADRLIYATATTHDLQLVTRDTTLRDFDPQRCIW